MDGAVDGHLPLTTKLEMSRDLRFEGLPSPTRTTLPRRVENHQAPIRASICLQKHTLFEFEDEDKNRSTTRSFQALNTTVP